MGLRSSDKYERQVNDPFGAPLTRIGWSQWRSDFAASLSIPGKGNVVFTFSVSKNSSSGQVARELGLGCLRSYVTWDKKVVFVYALPEGTIPGDIVSPGSSEFGYRSIREFILPDGKRIKAGGGGPRDLDSIRLLE